MLLRHERIFRVEGSENKPEPLPGSLSERSAIAHSGRSPGERAGTGGHLPPAPLEDHVVGAARTSSSEEELYAGPTNASSSDFEAAAPRNPRRSACAWNPRGRC